jgi:hypothetical protein
VVITRWEGVDEPARWHGPLEGGAGVVGGVGEVFGGGAGSPGGVDEGHGAVQPRGERLVGARPDARAHRAVGQGDLGAARLVEARLGEQHWRLLAGGEDLAGRLVADAPHPVAGQAVAFDDCRVETLALERLDRVPPEVEHPP